MTSIGDMARKELRDIQFIQKIVNDGFLVKEVEGLSGREEALALKECEIDNAHDTSCDCYDCEIIRRGNYDGSNRMIADEANK